jgi:arylsulfatase A-like enzyme
VKTPVLDDLAANGTLFTRGYATVSSCSSSRATLYTGLYSHTNGMYGLAHDVHNFSLLDEVKTLPWMLKQAGFRTALVGKKHVKPDASLPYDAWLAPEQPGIRDVAFMAREARRWIRTQSGMPFFGKRTLDAFLHRPSEELYELRTDPDEVVNLAGDPAHAAVLADLRNQIHDWRAATHDPWLPGVTDPFGHAH